MQKILKIHDKNYFLFIGLFVICIGDKHLSLANEINILVIKMSNLWLCIYLIFFKILFIKILII